MTERQKTAFADKQTETKNRNIMNKTIHTLACAAAALMLASCAGNDDDLGQVVVPGTDYELPQGKNSAADQTIMQYYEKYGSYFLYEFTDKDFEWSLVNTSTVGDDTYRYDAIDPAKVPNLLTAIQKGWLDFYTDDFLKKALPYRVLLAEDVQIRERTFDWSTWEYVFDWVNKPSRHIANQMALGNIDDEWDNLSAYDKRSFKSYVQTDFLQYCVEQGLITIPDEFYAVSDYSTEMSWSATSVDARNAGFVYDPHEDLEWSIDGSISKTADVNAFIASLVYRTTDQWADDLQYDYVKRKYDILVAALESAGIDILTIGNTTFK